MGTVVSVVVPTYLRPELLSRCLDALTEQTMPPDNYEVLIADDAASETTRRQVEDFGIKTSCEVRYVLVERVHGPAAARNAGWWAARAPIIAFTDDDTVPDPGWLAAGVGALERDAELAAVMGQVVVPLPLLPTDYERNEAGLETAEFVTANSNPTMRPIMQTPPPSIDLPRPSCSKAVTPCLPCRTHRPHSPMSG